MNDYTSELERALLAAGRRRADRRRPELGAVVAAASALGAVLIAVLAVALLSHGHTGRPIPPARAPHARSHPIEIGFPFAVLRRPQTAADRGLGDRYGYFPVGYGPIVPRDTRLLATLPGRRRIYLVVSSAAPLGPGRTYPPSGEPVVTIVCVVGGSGGVAYSPGETAPQLGRLGPGAVWSSDGYAFQIVPDHIVSVVWRLPGGGTRTIRVVRNLAVARVPAGSGAVSVLAEAGRSPLERASQPSHPHHVILTWGIPRLPG